MTDDRIYMECRECCYAVSGPFDSTGMYAKADTHEFENPGHVMQEANDG